MIQGVTVRVGYARVSSLGQSLEVQQSRLADCEKLFQEKASATGSKQPQLAACLEFVREGDTLAVTRLDRLARSTLHLCQIAEGLERKQVNLQVLDQQIDTSDATGRLLFNVLAAIAQFETELRAERQAEGIQKAKDRGVKFGRKKALDTDELEELRIMRDRGDKVKLMMRRFHLSKATIYRYLSEYDATSDPISTGESAATTG